MTTFSAIVLLYCELNQTVSQLYIYTQLICTFCTIYNKTLPHSTSIHNIMTPITCPYITQWRHLTRIQHIYSATPYTTTTLSCTKLTFHVTNKYFTTVTLLTCPPNRCYALHSLVRKLSFTLYLNDNATHTFLCYALRS